MKTLREITDYVYANEPHVRSWSKEQLDQFVRFHFSEGLICLVLDIDESIAGLVMIRPCLSPMDALDRKHFDQEGTCLHVSQVICTAKGALTALGFAVLKRFGMRKFVSWYRLPDCRLRVCKASTLRRHLLRKALA